MFVSILISLTISLLDKDTGIPAVQVQIISEALQKMLWVVLRDIRGICLQRDKPKVLTASVELLEVTPYCFKQKYGPQNQR